MKRAGLWGALVALSGLWMVQCGSGLPRPPAGPAPSGEEFSEVPYPPPPARVEIVPPKPASDAVWIDGQWIGFQRSRWEWDKGGWVKPPPGATFTAWSTKREPKGELLFAAPAWRDKDRKPIPPPSFLARARRGDPGKAAESAGDDDDESRLAVAAGDGGTSKPPPALPEPLLTDAGLSPPSLVPDASLPGKGEEDGGKNP